MADVRHILSLSGGKDSTALAVYLRDRVPQMEYVFCDTKKELQETYDYLDKIEAYLGKKIVRLTDDRGFDHWLQIKGGYLPSSHMRWCTEYLKIKPFERYVGSDSVKLYVGIRADEDRAAYVSRKPNIQTVLPFIEDNITVEGVYRLLEESGLGLPAYYSWRTRSGCYFCFFQRRAEWVGLLEHHPDLFEKAKAYEKVDPQTGDRYSWSQRESLEELSRPERVEEIKRAKERAIQKEQGRRRVSLPLFEILNDVYDDENDDQPCFFCQT
jgi:3'-phosphoadenosine 5'-phosphosulfate sulfotransferase (PAPS reductase)/FAD synthetase